MHASQGQRLKVKVSRVKTLGSEKAEMLTTAAMRLSIAADAFIHCRGQYGACAAYGVPDYADTTGVDIGSFFQIFDRSDMTWSNRLIPPS